MTTKVLSDPLGDRMKRQYENRARYLLPRRTNSIVRLDGKAFHTLTRSCDRPFDARFGDAMSRAAQAVVEEVQGAKIAYVQSDEISVLMTDNDSIATEAWFDGNIQKIVSVAASVASVAFTEVWGQAAHFDARVFTIPDPVEVTNYFVWRQKDAIRNSIQMCAQARFSPALLHGRKVDDLLGMLAGLGAPWTDQPLHWQRGWCVDRRTHTIVRDDCPDVIRHVWYHDFQIPIFTEHREYIDRLIPRVESPREDTIV